jgi:hypothetical protein
VRVADVDARDHQPAPVGSDRAVGFVVLVEEAQTKGLLFGRDEPKKLARRLPRFVEEAPGKRTRVLGGDQTDTPVAKGKGSREGVLANRLEAPGRPYGPFEPLVLSPL